MRIYKPNKKIIPMNFRGNKFKKIKTLLSPLQLCGFSHRPIWDSYKNRDSKRANTKDTHNLHRQALFNAD